MFTDLRSDLRRTLRTLARARTFTIGAVLCIALGVGATTAIFSAVSATLLRPVATPAVDRLVVVRDNLLKLDLPDSPVSPPEVFDLAARRDLFASGGGFDERGFVVTDAKTEATSTRYMGARTVGDFFGVFRVRPYLGRLYRPEEARGGRHLVVVLSHAVWLDRFGGDSSVIGRSLRVNDRAYQIVGVLPPEFRYPRRAQLYAPLPIDSAFEQLRISQFITAVFRLKDGVSFEAVRAALPAEAAAWRERYPKTPYAQWGNRLSIVPFFAFEAGQLRPVLLVLLGAVAVLLLVACANVACLQLVRATARAHELSVRAALGATRSGIARLLVIESTVVALLGGVAGLLLGWATTRVLMRFAPADPPALQNLRLDGPTLTGTLAVVVLVALLGSALPAVRASRVDLRGALQEEGRSGTDGGRGRYRLLGIVMAAQVALSLFLLLGSGVMLRSLARLLEVSPGFRSERVVTGSVALPFAAYGPLSGVDAFYNAVLDRLRATPGITAASVISQVPLAGGAPTNSSPVTIIGHDTTGQGGPPHANLLVAGDDYFRTLGIPLLRGRMFGQGDAQRPTPGPGAMFSAIVDEEFVRRYLPGEDPIGRRISQGPPATIVGVVGAIRQDALSVPPKPTVYYDRHQWFGKTYSFVVRSTLSDAAALRALRNAVAAADRRVPVFDLASMDDVMARSVGTRRFGTVVLVTFAAVALVLAVVGIYGVLSYVVAQRTREIGIRAALGARPRDLTRLVLRDGGRLVGLGLLVGALAFVVFGRVLASQVYGVGPRDLLTIVSGGALLAAVALIACWLPARRAAQVDPVSALRADEHW